MKVSSLYMLTILIGWALVGCGSHHNESTAQQPNIGDEDQGERIKAFSIAYAVEDGSSPGGFKFATFIVDDPEKVQSGIGAIEATGYAHETHSSSLPFNKILFLGENETKQEAYFIKKELLEMGNDGIQEMTPSFYGWACKAASEHAGESIELLKIN